MTANLKTVFWTGLAFMWMNQGVSEAAPCGGRFPAFVEAMQAEAVAAGADRRAAAAFFGAARLDERVLRADRAQGIFRKDFIDFARTIISQNRLVNGRRNAERYAAVFAEAERRFGVSRGVLLAFWALETDFGAVQGDFNTLNALMTLSYDCRRPELFQPQVFAALKLYERGQFELGTTGAWAGEPWLQEVVVPEGLDWAKTGLDTELTVAEWQRMGVRARTGGLPSGRMPASVLLPMGRKGPAFLAYPNFRVFFEWNKSFVYVTTAAYFATRLEGAPVYDPGNPEPGLSDGEMKSLQKKLAARGHDVGAIDGILGEKTREAVQKEQARLNLPADAWPTRALLSRM